MNRPSRENRAGFTLVELCATITGLVFFAVVAVPALAGTRSQSARLHCVSNLGEIGRGYNLWAAEHQDTYPFLLPSAEGGLRQPHNGLQVNSWYQFAWISNELSSARVLACPADRSRTPADDFSANAGGLLSPSRRNNSISYFLTYPAYPTSQTALSGDRNVLADSYGNGCSIFGPSSAASVRLGAIQTISWSESIHSRSGNLLLRDGAVEQAGTTSLREKFASQDTDNGSVHLLLP